MTSIYVELPNDLYEQLQARLESGKEDLYQLMAEAIAEKLKRETPC